MLSLPFSFKENAHFEIYQPLFKYVKAYQGE